MAIKNFSIFKVKDKKNDKQPDYRLSTKVGDVFVDIGAGWIKETENSKYISVKLADAYKGFKGDKPGFELVEEKPLGMAPKEVAKVVKDMDKVVYPEDINADEIPF